MPRRKRILIVDDNPVICDVVGDMLGKKGYQTLIVGDMEAALSELEINSFDVVVADIFLPGIGGIEGIKRLREKWPETKIIAISGGLLGMNQEDALNAARKVGADQVLKKPFIETDLYTALEGLGI
jgi:CheY-like chemotaxis protein